MYDMELMIKIQNVILIQSLILLSAYPIHLVNHILAILVHNSLLFMPIRVLFSFFNFCCICWGRL